jgi:hypothetical protein
LLGFLTTIKNVLDCVPSTVLLLFLHTIELPELKSTSIASIENKFEDYFLRRHR